MFDHRIYNKKREGCSFENCTPPNVYLIDSQPCFSESTRFRYCLVPYLLIHCLTLLIEATPICSISRLDSSMLFLIRSAATSSRQFRSLPLPITTHLLVSISMPYCSYPLRFIYSQFTSYCIVSFPCHIFDVRLTHFLIKSIRFHSIPWRLYSTAHLSFPLHTSSFHSLAFHKTP